MVPVFAMLRYFRDRLAAPRLCPHLSRLPQH